MATEEKLEQIANRLDEINTTLAGNLEMTLHNIPATMQEKTITVNGEFYPDVDFEGFSKVTVNVPNETEEKLITSNGEFSPTEGKIGFSKVTVSVDTGNYYIAKNNLENSILKLDLLNPEDKSFVLVYSGLTVEDVQSRTSGTSYIILPKVSEGANPVEWEAYTFNIAAVEDPEGVKIMFSLVDDENWNLGMLIDALKKLPKYIDAQIGDQVVFDKNDYVYYEGSETQMAFTLLDLDNNVEQKAIIKCQLEKQG